MATEYSPFALLASAMAFLAILLLLVGLWQAGRRRAWKRQIVEKVQASTEAWTEVEKLDLLLAPEVHTRGSLKHLLSSIGSRMVSEESTEYARLRTSFVRAGLRRPNLPALFWGTKFALGAALPALFLSARIWVIQPLPFNLTLGICLFLALCGFYIPEIWLRRRIAVRKRTIFEGLPDALDLLVVCVEAGMGLDAAMNRVAEELALANKPLSDELKLFNLELRAGKSRPDAMKHLAGRIDLEDMRSLVTLLIQTDRFGTSLGDALRVYSDSFRTKRYMMAEEIAAKLPAKLLFPLILCIFPALFVAILGPAIIRLLDVLGNR